MEQDTNRNPLLDWIAAPAFSVKDGVILQVNEAAAQLQLTAGTPITELTEQLPDSSSQNGNITLTVAGLPHSAAFTRVADTLVLCLWQDNQTAVHNALSLASQQLRIPLATAMTLSDAQDQKQEQAAQLSRALYQMQRILCNLADTVRYRESKANMQTADLPAIFDEVMDKAAAYLAEAGLTLRYTTVQHSIYGTADREMLSRAVYNLLSNAAKFSRRGGVIEAKLTHSSGTLCLTVQDQGGGIPTQILGTVCSRYLRQPGIEDSRHGMGMGLSLVQAVAAAHGGTVLIDQPEGGGSRVCMTIAIRQSGGDLVRCPILPMGDYAGGRDAALLEFSDILPWESFTGEY